MVIAIVEKIKREKERERETKRKEERFNSWIAESAINRIFQAQEQNRRASC